MILEFFAILFAFINILTFLLYALDKRKAVRGGWRINESVLIFFTLALGGFGAFLGMMVFRHKTKRKKFKLSVFMGLVLSLVFTIHILHGFTLGQFIQFIELPFQNENWPAELSGYRIAFMTDFHAITEEEMREVVLELNERNIDLLLLGGDFSMRNNHYQGTLVQISQTKTTDGIFGVEGNHDDYRRLFSMKEELGITPLDNSGLHIRNGFFLGGVQDLWNRKPSIEEAIKRSNYSDFILLISHNPDVAMQQQTHDIDLILSGHTHNGQITFFGIPFYLLRDSITAYGMRFAHGFAYSADDVPVFISSGVGRYFSIPRVFVSPEVVIFTMHSQ
ncbi:MAG: DUF1294 domain-containing protein [Defluviitaleaceae bacterium]|nr:DUF1294 domain-containing protein [Defluviitaleaceae bacterium]